VAVVVAGGACFTAAWPPCPRKGGDDGLSDAREPGREGPMASLKLCPAPTTLLACSSDMPMESIPRRSLLEGFREGFPISEGRGQADSDLLPTRSLPAALGPFEAAADAGRESGTSSCSEAIAGGGLEESGRLDAAM
jgi:hypothetical protein